MSQHDQYTELYNNFRWLVPQWFNLGHECCGKWAGDTTRIALICEDEQGTATNFTYAQLQADANRLSNALVHHGVRRGDRVAIMLPQCAQTVVAHVACYQMGAVAMPLSVLFGPDALEYRLIDSGAVAALVDAHAYANLAPVLGRCPCLKSLIAIETVAPAAGTNAPLDYARLLAESDPRFAAAATRASGAILS